MKTLDTITKQLDKEVPVDPQARRALATELASFLRDTESETHYRVCHYLRKLGREAAAAGHQLIPLLDDVDRVIAAGAIEVFGAMGPEFPEAVPLLISKLIPETNDEASRRRIPGIVTSKTSYFLGEYACRALASYGPLAEEAVGILMGVLGWGTVEYREIYTGNAQFQHAAVFTLGRIGSEKGVPALMDYVERHVGDAYGVAAAEALGNIGPKATSAVPTLIKVIEKAQNSWPTQMDPMLLKARQIKAAANALGKIGSSDHNSQARKILQTLASDDYLDRIVAGVSAAAKEALGLLTRCVAAAAPQQHLVVGAIA